MTQDNMREIMIDRILPNDVDTDDIVELIETGMFGMSLESIYDSEIDDIWDMEEDTIVGMFDDREYWDSSINHIGESFIYSMRMQLIDDIDIETLIRDEQLMYEDIIYQALDCMHFDTLNELYETLFDENPLDAVKES